MTTTPTKFEAEADTIAPATFPFAIEVKATEDWLWLRLLSVDLGVVEARALLRLRLRLLLRLLWSGSGLDVFCHLLRVEIVPGGIVAVEKRLGNSTLRAKARPLCGLGERAADIIEFRGNRPHLAIELRFGVIDGLARRVDGRAHILNHLGHALRADDDDAQNHDDENLGPTNGRKHG